MTYDSRAKSFSCDECPESIEVDADDFAEAKAEVKSKGWRRYIGPDNLWADSCPSCTEDFAKRQRR